MICGSSSNRKSYISPCQSQIDDDLSEPPSYNDVILGSGVENLSFLIEISGDNDNESSSRTSIYRHNSTSSDLILSANQITHDNYGENVISLESNLSQNSNNLQRSYSAVETYRFLSEQHEICNRNLNLTQHQINANRATLIPTTTNVDFDNEVLSLHKAFIDCEKSILMDILSRHSSVRFDIVQCYDRTYTPTLLKCIDNLESLAFGDILRGLSMPFYKYVARSIQSSKYYKWMCYIISIMSNSLRELIIGCLEANNIESE